MRWWPTHFSALEWHNACLLLYEEHLWRGSLPATVAQLKLETLAGTSAVHIDSCPTHGLGILQPREREAVSLHDSDVYISHQLKSKVGLCSLKVKPKLCFLSASSARHVISLEPVTLLFRGLKPCVLNATLFPAPHPSRLSLSTEETPGPGRGAHVQLLMFLRPSVLVMECSPNISLTSAETLPRAFAVVPTKYRTSVALSHGIYPTTEALCCHKERLAMSHLCQVTGSNSGKPTRWQIVNSFMKSSFIQYLRWFYDEFGNMFCLSIPRFVNQAIFLPNNRFDFWSRNRLYGS